MNIKNPWLNLALIFIENCCKKSLFLLNHFVANRANLKEMKMYFQKKIYKMEQNIVVTSFLENFFDEFSDEEKSWSTSSVGDVM